MTPLPVVYPRGWDWRNDSCCVCIDDTRMEHELFAARKMYGSIGACGVTPPVIPQHFREPLADIVPHGIPGRMLPWKGDPVPFRDATAGRSDHTKLVDYEIMCNTDDD